MTHMCILVNSTKEPEQIVRYKTQLLTIFFLSSGSQNPFLQIIVPEKIQENTSDNLELENVRDIFHNII